MPCSTFLQGGDRSALQQKPATSRSYVAAQLAPTTYNYDKFNRAVGEQEHEAKHWVATLDYAVRVSNLPITRALLKRNVFEKTLPYYPHTFILLNAAEAVQRERSSCCSFDYGPYAIFEAILGHG